MHPAVYILANKSNRVLYVGVTSNLALRYRRNENAAPVVVARGLDHLALQIRHLSAD